MLAADVDAKVLNKGINGDTTSDMLRRFDRAVLQHKPTHVVIMGGINDVWCGESFDRITWNIDKMAMTADRAGIKVILATPTAVDEPSIEKLLIRIRQWIRNYAAENHMGLIDFAQAFYDKNGRIMSELLLADGGHPDIDGYVAMYKQIDLNLFK